MLFSALLLATAPSGPQDPEPMALGINPEEVTDWATAWTFVDQFRAARTWLTRRVGSYDWESFMQDEIPVDGDGWPLVVPFPASDGNDHFVHTIVPVYALGDHTVIVEGSGRFRFTGAVHTPEITVTGGTSTFTLPIDGTAGMTLYFDLLESDAADPLRDVRVVMPGFESTYQTDPFHPEFLSRLDRFGSLRFMGLQATNNTPLVEWSERTTPSTYTQTGSKGIAYELIAQLANIKAADAWVCVPHMASEEFVRELARLLRDQVDPGLDVWVEYSNETWNSIFEQYQYVEQQGLALGLDGDPYVAGNEYTTLRSVQIWEIFLEEFVDDDRLKLVLSTQASWTYPTQLRFDALLDPAINPGQLMPDALGVAPYFGINYTPQDIPPIASSYPTVDEIHEVGIPQLLDQVQGWLEKQRELAELVGASLACYEAGQHFTGIFGAENDPVLESILHEANRDPRMYEQYIDYLDRLQAEGVVATNHWTYIGEWSKWGSWGALEYTDQPLGDAPKYRALVDWMPLQLSAAPTSLSAGTGGVVDFELAGGTAHAGRAYVLLAGASGTDPGTELPSGQVLPLNQDAVFDWVVANLGGAGLQGFQGSLDGGGAAQAKLDTLGPLPAGLAGSTLHFAYALTNPWGHASSTAAVDVTP